MSDKAPEIVMLAMSNYIRPDIVEVTSKDWVLNGKNNSFYQYTIDRFNGSPTNAAIINSYVDLIYGKGLRAKNANTEQGLKDWTRLKTILMSKDLRRIINDFELFGQASMDIIQTNGKGLSSISHIAQNLTAPSIENDDCEIEKYFVSKDWSKHAQAKFTPKPFPAFDGKASQSIYSIKPYKAGKNYFADPDYLAGMPYAEMEEEIANLNINSIKNGLSAGYIINVPDGINLTSEQRKKFKADVEKQLTGSSNATTFVMSWNARDVEITITPFPVNQNIHKQWEFLTGESRQQLLTAHRVTSPMLFGIKDNTGFGNNAEELDTAEAQLMKRVIAPKQAFIIDALEEVLTAYGINLDLEFIPLTESNGEKQSKTAIGAALPSAPVDEDTAKAQASLRGSVGGVTGILGIQTSVTEGKTDFDSAVTILMEIYGFDREVALSLLGKPKQTPQIKTQFSSDCEHNYSAQDLIDLGETEDLENYDIVDEVEVDYDEVIQLASTGVARPNAKSEQDSKDVLIRYRYVGNNAPQRSFCQLMMSANKIYRKEDIIQMENKAVNPGWGLNGANTYSIWLYKGGGNCYHKWNRVIYLKKGIKIDVNSPLAKTISTSKARQQGFKTPANDSRVSIAPINMPNNGFKS
jgi:hypothetical protein